MLVVITYDVNTEDAGGRRRMSKKKRYGNGSVVDSITDWKLGGTYTVDGWVMGLAYISTNRNLAGYTSPGKNISNGTAVVSVTKTF